MDDDDDDVFKHDLIIANKDGRISWIKPEVWAHTDYLVPPEKYINDGWKLVRELLECGVTLAAIPPKDFLPPDTPRPEGTCYLVNIEGLKESHKFHRKPKPKPK